MRPLEVLDQQVDLIRWWRSPEGHRYARIWIEAGHGIAVIGPDGEVVEAADRTNEQRTFKFMRPDGTVSTDPEMIGDHFAIESALALDRGDTFVVADSMTEMIFRASQHLPRTALNPVDVPSPAGFVVFNRSIWDTDIHGQSISWRAVSWSPTLAKPEGRLAGFKTGDGLKVTFYTDTRAPDVRTTDTAIAEMLARGASMQRWVPLHTTAWQFGIEWDPAAWEDGAGMHSSVDVARRVLTAFWAISQQYVERIRRLPADRHLRKRIERAGLLTDRPKEVKVVTLRKIHERLERDPDHEPRSVPWSHRWTVSGHWRNQAVKEGHRIIWIDEYEKGPEHLPLVEKDAVYKVTR